MLDAGHGGKDPGAVGPTGLTEASVVLAVVSLAGAILLDAGAEVFYTRKDDRFLELSERAALGNRAGVHLFLSVHCNSADNPASGFEVWTTPGQTVSDPPATQLFSTYGLSFPELKKRADLGDGDPDKEAKFTVLQKSKGPAVLFELEFIHTLEGEAFLRDKKNQLKMAQALAAGVAIHFGLPLPGADPLEPPVIEVPGSWEPLPPCVNLPRVRELADRMLADQQAASASLKLLVAQLTAHVTDQERRLGILTREISKLSEGGQGA